MNVLITGAAGFIGSHLVKYMLNKNDVKSVIAIDHMSYAANIKNLKCPLRNNKFNFYETDISHHKNIQSILCKHNISHIINLAAESHVDNSIEFPDIFFQNNVMKTYEFVKTCYNYWTNILQDNDDFRFIHISTDEVYGDLDYNDITSFTERSTYAPNSPYSASKACSDHILRCFNKTYKFPVITTHCSNNFGTNQHHEKLIPKVIYKALQGEDIPIYGTGKNIRDWIFVEDHCDGIYLALTKGSVGETYCFGGGYEKSNINLVTEICVILDKVKPKKKGSYTNQISFVVDRQGHDRKYSLNYSKAKKELGFTPKIDSFDKRLYKVVLSYVEKFKRSKN